ncbi:ammonium transporter, partial [Microcoleus sp. HI-ES]|nr:ammonium transporter [Microcoleus sp. HI-ES]
MTVGKNKSKQVRRDALNLPSAKFFTKVNRLKKLPRAIARLTPSWQACIPIAAIIVLVWGYAAVAQTAPAPTTEEQLASLKVGMDTMWVMVAAMLVFFMIAGFCMLETGFCRQQIAVNVLSKNLIV